MASAQFPHKITQDENADDYVQVGPKKYYIPKGYEKEYLNIYNFEVRKDDVWILGLPRSGTTVTQEILWLLANNLDYEKALATILDKRVSNFDHLFLLNRKMFKAAEDNCKTNIMSDYNKLILEQLSDNTKRRLIKSHLPTSLLSPKIFSSGCKVVYCARNPKDLAVSMYHGQKLVRLNPNQEFAEFWKIFQNNKIMHTPFFEHVKEGWNRRNDPNFMFMFYEDINKDKKGAIKKLANFLGKKLDESQLEKLEDHVNIENFRKNKSVNREYMVKSGIAIDEKEHQFIRKGETGGWKKYFTPELNIEADKWIEDHLKGTGIVFPQ